VMNYWFVGVDTLTGHLNDQVQRNIFYLC